jgi:N-acetylmuramoyl-L-alanine amidase
MVRSIPLFRLLTALMLLLLVAGWACGEEREGPPRKKGSTTRKATAKKTEKGGKKGGKKAKKGGKQAPAAAPKAAAVETKPPLAVVKEIRSWSTPDYTRVAVTLDREVSFEKHQIAQGPGSQFLSRLYFDINGAKVGPGVKDLSIGDGFLKTARLGQYRQDTVRVVLDVDHVKDHKIFTFSDPFRIIVDVKGERREEISRLDANIQPLVPQPEPKKEEIKEPEKPAVPFKPGKIRRIVVDPGHGGKDPGAIGQGGLQEKDVVLAMGLMLSRKLRDELGIDVVMTRSSDIFIELQERTAIANQVGADLFVSIHANASLNRGASGVETYYLNLAKTEKAAQLAARENGTSLEKVSLLQAVLFDLMANYKLNDSAHLAEEVQKAVHRKVSGEYANVKNLGVKQGPFYVLVGATMPSILVETAFISNEREEGRLQDPQYQETAVTGIVDGIRAYIASLK